MAGALLDKSLLSSIQKAVGGVNEVFGGTGGGLLLDPTLRGIYGVPLQHFCLRYFFGSNILPAQKVILAAGAPGTLKTSLCLEFERLLMDYYAKTYALAIPSYAIHTEDKWPDTLPPSLMGAELVRQLQYQKADVAQEWMKILMKMMSGELATNEALKRVVIPTFVDSISGAQGQERDAKIHKKGAPERDFSEIARVLAEWLPSFTSQLEATSAIVFMIMHLKGKDEDSFRTPGGQTKDFFSSYTLYLFNPYKKINPVTREGELACWMKMHKDSYGPGHTTIPVTMEWKYGEDNQQITRFRWEETTTFLLDNWMNDSNPDKRVSAKSPVREFLEEIEHVNHGSKGVGYRCKPITGKDDLNSIDFARAIEANEKVRLELDRIFRITTRPTAEEVYARLDADAEAREAAKKRGKKAVSVPVLGPVVPAAVQAQVPADEVKGK